MPLKLNKVIEISTIDVTYSLNHCLTQTTCSPVISCGLFVFVGQMSSKNVNEVSPHCKQHLCTFPDDGHMQRD